MRIISIRMWPLARSLSIVYALLGFVGFGQFVYSDAQYLTLPLGVVAPLVYLNINLNLPRSTSVGYNLLCCFSEVIAYAISGWITGAAAALCFNFAAKRMGGIDAKYFSTTDDEKSTNPNS